MSATEADVEAATNAETPPTPDGSAEPKQGAESAPAVKDPDESLAQGVKSRIDELTRYRRDAERERDYWRSLAEKSREAPPEKAVETVQKTLADFQYDESKYQQYLFGEAQSRAVQAAEKRLQEAQVERARQEVDLDYAERVDEYVAKVPDYYEVVESPNLRITRDMAETIKESERGPEIAYHLGKNPRLAEQISRLSPLQQAREIGRIEAKLSDKPAPRVSEAPPPAAKIDAVESQVEKDPDKMTAGEWLKWRNKQVNRKK